MATANDPPDVALFEPSHDALYREVGLARTKGAGSLEAARQELPKLLGVARVISDAADDAVKIEDALQQAIRRLGGIGTTAVEALMGLTPETHGQAVEKRRTRAAQLYEHKDYEYFRTRIEPALLMFVATYLRVLTDESRLAERELALASAERGRELNAVFARASGSRTGETERLWLRRGVYHVQFPRERFPTWAFVYTVNQFVVPYRIEEARSAGKVKRLFGRTNRRYVLHFTNTEVLAHRRPNWLKRIRRRAIVELIYLLK